MFSGEYSNTFSEIIPISFLWFFAKLLQPTTLIGVSSVLTFFLNAVRPSPYVCAMTLPLLSERVSHPRFPLIGLFFLFLGSPTFFLCYLPFCHPAFFFEEYKVSLFSATDSRPVFSPKSSLTVFLYNLITKRPCFPLPLKGTFLFFFLHSSFS